VEDKSYQDILSKWASGVTVVCFENAGLKYGITVSSFTSVSLNPKLVAICIDKSVSFYNDLIASGDFSVNILSTKQVFWGERFAGFHKDIEDQFQERNFITKATGSPIFEESLGWLDCKIWDTVDAGDHTMFIGEVIAGAVNEGEPVVYFNRSWRGISDQVIEG